MKKIDFLNELYAYLSPLPKNEREEIIGDFKEHFREGAAAGKTEEQICLELGSPLECARQYVGEVSTVQTFNPPQSKTKKTFWTGALIFNLIQAVLSVPLTIGLFAASVVMCVAFIFIVPAVSSTAFLVFAISSTVAVLLLAVLTLLLAIDGIRDCIKGIRRN